MIVIDGGMLEGGGQIIRTAVAAAALTGDPVHITNIRRNRSSPGLAAQHLAAVRAAAAVSGARVVSGEIGSTEILFYPGTLEKKDVTIDIGTAGSIPLVLSAWLPIALRCGGSITVTGGTEVKAAPTIDYFKDVFLQYLIAHGARVSLTIGARGYFPTGGGTVQVIAMPSELMPTGSAQSTGSGIISASCGLFRHVAERQAKSAAAIAGDLPVRIDRQKGPGIGSSCTVYSGSHGGSALGRRGLPAEDVGRMAAEAYLFSQGGDVDFHLFDQLLLYLAMNTGSLTTSRLTLHARTVVWLLEHFGYHISIVEKKGFVEASL